MAEMHIGVVRLLRLSSCGMEYFDNMPVAAGSHLKLLWMVIRSMAGGEEAGRTVRVKAAGYPAGCASRLAVDAAVLAG